MKNSNRPPRLTALLLLFLVSGCSVFGDRSGTEEVRYKVAETLGENLEIRRYAPRAAAEVAMPLEEGEEPDNAAFRLLFDYITGANEGSRSLDMTAPVESRAGAEEIAMTVPVESTRDDERYVMRFFLPAGIEASNAPRPTSGRIDILALPAETQAVLRFTGSRSERAVAERKRALLAALEDGEWRAAGSPVAYFYDPPWTLPFLRRNEVAVRVEPVSAAGGRD